MTDQQNQMFFNAQNPTGEQSVASRLANYKLQQEQEIKNRLETYNAYINGKNAGIFDRFKSGVLGTIGNYQASFGKAIDNTLGSDAGRVFGTDHLIDSGNKMRRDAEAQELGWKQANNNGYNIAGFAGDMVGDPLSYIGAGAVGKGYKLGTIAKNALIGSSIGSVDSASQNYGNKDMSSDDYNKNIIGSAVGGAVLGAGLPAVFSGIGDIVNRAKSEYYKGAGDTSVGVENTKQPINTQTINNQQPIKTQNINQDIKIAQGINNQYSSTISNKAIMTESKGDYNAVNKTTGAFGKYQFMPNILKSYAKKAGLTLDEAKTPQGQETIYKIYAHDVKNQLINKGLEPTQFNMDMAHQQGATGWYNILRGKIGDREIAAMEANLPKSAYKTGDLRTDFINYWTKKYGGNDIHLQQDYAHNTTSPKIDEIVNNDTTQSNHIIDNILNDTTQSNPIIDNILNDTEQSNHIIDDVSPVNQDTLKADDKSITNYDKATIDDLLSTQQKLNDTVNQDYNYYAEQPYQKQSDIQNYYQANTKVNDISTKIDDIQPQISDSHQLYRDILDSGVDNPTDYMKVLEARANATGDNIDNFLVKNPLKVKNGEFTPQELTNATFEDLQQHPRYQELLNNRENIGYKEQNMSGGGAYKRPIYDETGQQVAIRNGKALYNYNKDFTLLKSDVAQLRKGNPTPKILDKLRADLGRLDNDPNYRDVVSGQIDFSKDKAVITLFRDADPTTLIHEFGHYFRRTLNEAENAEAEILFGVKNGKWDIEAEERFANGFTKFLAEGKAPTPQLTSLFEKFKALIKQTWGKILQNADSNFVLTDAQRDFFRALMGDKEMAQKLFSHSTEEDFINSLLNKHNKEANGVFDEIGNPLYQKVGKQNEIIDNVNGKYNNAIKNNPQYADEIALREAKIKGYEPYTQEGHSAPINNGFNESIDNIKDMFPSDIYSANGARYYGSGLSYDKKAVDILKSVKGNPDKQITIYRAVPSDVKSTFIRNGDWVTTTKEYAIEHGRHALNGEFKIISEKVPAKHIYTDGNSIHEYGYDDGIKYVYKNTENGKKILHSDTDIPISDRFDESNPNILYQKQPFKEQPIENQVIDTARGKSALYYLGKVISQTEDLANNAITSVIRGIGKGVSPLLDKIAPTDSKIYNFVKGLEDNKLTDLILGHKIYKETEYLKIRDFYNRQSAKNNEEIEMLHRQLALFSPETREAMKYYMSGDKNIELPNEIKQVCDNFSNHIDNIGQELVDLGVLEQEQYNKFKGMYLTRFYEDKDAEKIGIFDGSSKGIGKIQSRGLIQTVDKKFVDELKSRDMIDNSQEGWINGKYSVRKLSNNKYEVSRDWTPQERQEWKEINDIAFVLPQSLHYMNNLLENARFFKNVADNSGFVLNHEANGFVKLSGNKYGKLNGKYVPYYVESDINDFSKAFSGEEFEGVRKILGYWNKTHTVFNQVAHFNNIMSNISTYYMAGVNPATATKNALSTIFINQKYKAMRELEAKTLIGLTEDETKTLNLLKQDDDVVLFEQAKKAGLFGGGNVKNILNDYRNKTSDTANTSYWGKFDNLASKMYANEDDFMKFGLLKTYMDKGMGFEDALANVNKNMVDYTQPKSKLMKVASQIGIAPYTSYFYHMTPKIIQQAKDNPTRVLAMIGAYMLINKKFGINPYDNSQLPDNFGGNRIPIYKNGHEITTLKVDRWIPASMFFTPLETINDTFSGGAYMDVKNLIQNSNGMGGKITQETNPILRGLDYAEATAKIASPDFIDNLFSTANSMMVDKKYRKNNSYIVPRSEEQNIIKMLGLNTLTYDQQKLKEQVEKDNNNANVKDIDKIKNRPDASFINALLGHPYH